MKLFLRILATKMVHGLFEATMPETLNLNTAEHAKKQPQQLKGRYFSQRSGSPFAFDSKTLSTNSIGCFR